MDCPGSPGLFSEVVMEDTRSWAYRLDEKGEVEGRIFASKPDIPEGWVDTPAKLTGESEPKSEEPEPQKMPDISGMTDDEAKAAIDQWADGIGIKLDRRKSLTNMLAQLEQALGHTD